MKQGRKTENKKGCLDIETASFFKLYQICLKNKKFIDPTKDDRFFLLQEHLLHSLKFLYLDNPFSL